MLCLEHGNGLNVDEREVRIRAVGERREARFK
jgi:hypothetical protein